MTIVTMKTIMTIMTTTTIMTAMTLQDEEENPKFELTYFCSGDKDENPELSPSRVRWDALS